MPAARLRAAVEPTAGAQRFTPRERALIRRLRTPEAVQAWLNKLPYNRETKGETCRTLRGVLEHGEAHCLEAALVAATILEHHGHPPILLDFDSQDGLGHVLFLFRRGGAYGAVARSRDPGLHGRRPVYRNPYTLAMSYAAPYIDGEGRVTAYGLLDLRTLPRADWRWSRRNVWYVERVLIEHPHRRLSVSNAYYWRWYRRYKRFKAAHPDARPTYYPNRSTWMWP